VAVAGKYIHVDNFSGNNLEAQAAKRLQLGFWLSFFAIITAYSRCFYDSYAVFSFHSTPGLFFIGRKVFKMVL